VGIFNRLAIGEPIIIGVPIGVRLFTATGYYFATITDITEVSTSSTHHINNGHQSMETDTYLRFRIVKAW
jgi:hypothetical protein